jgi:hypothetical protein
MISSFLDSTLWKTVPIESTELIPRMISSASMRSQQCDDNEALFKTSETRQSFLPCRNMLMHKHNIGVPGQVWFGPGSSRR